MKIVTHNLSMESMRLELAGSGYCDKYNCFIKMAQFRFLKWLKTRGIKDLSLVSKNDIYKYQAVLLGYISERTGKRMARGTLSDYYTAVKMLFSALCRAGLLKINITSGITFELPKDKGIKRQAFSDEKMSEILEKMDINTPAGLRDRALFELLYSSGLRVSEAANLLIKDISLQRREMIVRGKFSRDRVVPFSDPDGRTPRGGQQIGRNGTMTPMNTILPVQTSMPFMGNNTSSASVSGRISMVDAYNAGTGPCMFRALLGIAETRTGQTLTQAQLHEARDRFYGTTPFDDWSVEEPHGLLQDVINIGMELLGSDERAIWTGRVDSINKIPEGTQATILGRQGIDSPDGFHFGEGDAMGNLLFDPLGRDTFEGQSIIRVDTFKFHTQ